MCGKGKTFGLEIAQLRNKNEIFVIIINLNKYALDIDLSKSPTLIGLVCVGYSVIDFIHSSNKNILLLNWRKFQKSPEYGDPGKWNSEEEKNYWIDCFV